MWQQLFCPNRPYFKAIFIKVSKSFIFYWNHFWATFFRHLATFYWSPWQGSLESRNTFPQFGFGFALGRAHLNGKEMLLARSRSWSLIAVVHRRRSRDVKNRFGEVCCVDCFHIAQAQNRHHNFGSKDNILNSWLVQSMTSIISTSSMLLRPR